MMREKHILHLNRILLLLLALFILPSSGFAVEATTYTFSPSASGKEMQVVQDAYLPSSIYSDLGLSSPQDLDVKAGKMYIADTGNKRILRIDLTTGEKDEIGQKLLKQPTGVAVDSEGRIYVADYKNKAAYRFSSDGELEQTFSRPETAAYSDTASFSPRKIAASGDGGIYLLVDGAVNGLLQMNAKGEFLGYFASNSVKKSLYMRILETILTEEQLSRMLNLATPDSFGNILMGEDGLLYSIAMGKDCRLQKHSYNGSNMFARFSILPVIDNPVDIAMGTDYMLYVLDSQGMISEISQDGIMLYRFGGTGDGSSVIGLFDSPSGIGTDEAGNLYVLDKKQNLIQVFSPTAVHNAIRQAISDYTNGDYDRVRSTLEEAVRINGSSLFSRLYLGRTYMHQGMDQEAAAQFRAAKDRSLYSDAFWNLRNAWLSHNMTWILPCIAGIVIITILLKKRFGSRRQYDSYQESKKLSSQWRGLQWSVLRRAVFHPIDTAYEIRIGHMGGYGVSVLLLVITFFVIQARNLLSGFLYSSDLEEYDLLIQAALFISLYMLFVFCNFFIASIRDGKGGLREIISVVAYAQVPILLLFPLLTLISNALTLNESLIIQTVTAATVIYCFVLLCVMLMEVHEYSFGQLIGNLLLTVFSMVVAVLLLSLFYLLIKQIVNFVLQLYTEVSIRV